LCFCIVSISLLIFFRGNFALPFGFIRCGKCIGSLSIIYFSRKTSCFVELVKT
jgi:hypothetical protein